MSLAYAETTERIRSLGKEILPAIPGSIAIYAEVQEREPYSGVEVIRDARYGPHERHRLDVFRTTEAGAAPKPIFVFVHGGGFVGGDKRTPGSPYNDNVALWAARHGMVGVNITYRLAPEFTYPVGSEDLASAIGWVREHAPEFGGDPQRIFVLGTSAGAVHVAVFLAQPMFEAARRGVKGGMLLSGAYALEAPPADAPPHPYFGPDGSKHRAMSSLPGLLESPIPILFAIAEFEPSMFEHQAQAVIDAWTKRHGSWPEFIRMMGHNHLTATLHLNSGDEVLGQQLLAFMGRC
jgi:triacylglycerol lipase